VFAPFEAAWIGAVACCVDNFVSPTNWCLQENTHFSEVADKKASKTRLGLSENQEIYFCK